MINIEDAQQIILKQVIRLTAKEIPLLNSLGRVTAENVHAPWDIPMSDNSAMDGYAFSSLSERSEFGVVTDFIPAGSQRITPVGLGEAVRIMTGAPVPPGCDTVVPIEEVEQIPDGIRLKNGVKAGAHIRLRGEDVKINELVLPAGSEIRPQEIGLLVALGMTTIRAYRPIRVAILATGDELQVAGSVPGAGRIINSNSYSLAAQVMEAGGEPFMIGIAADNAHATKEKIREGLQADMLITTGGVSVGDRDFVKESIQDIGGDLLFWKVNMKPGKPVAFAMLEGKPVFALPGNPVAAMVGFELFVRPAMLWSMGHSHLYRPKIKALLSDDIRNRGDRPHLVSVKVTLDHGECHASVAGNQSSANLSSLTQSNGLLCLIPNSSLAAGSIVEVILLDRGFEIGRV
jgi:molybdopterin molybdotransferase